MHNLSVLSAHWTRSRESFVNMWHACWLDKITAAEKMILHARNYEYQYVPGRRSMNDRASSILFCHAPCPFKVIIFLNHYTTRNWSFGKNVTMSSKQLERSSLFFLRLIFAKINQVCDYSVRNINYSGNYKEILISRIRGKIKVNLPSLADVHAYEIFSFGDRVIEFA